MLGCIATRELMYSVLGDDIRSPLTFRVFPPFELQEGMVDHAFSKGTAGCTYEIVGLPKRCSHTCIGGDLLQALQLAVDVDGHLRMFKKKYEFFFPDGEPYFED